MTKYAKVFFALTFNFILFSHSWAYHFTDSRRYSPFIDAPLQKTPKITESIEGVCKKGSTLTARVDAWRCETAQKVFDPCFVQKYQNRDRLICPTSPWGQTATAISIHHLLLTDRESLDMSKSSPWTVELTNGARCIRLKPEEVNTSGEKKKYRCNNGEYLVGAFYRCKGLWEIFSTNDEHYQRVFIERAWF